MAFLLGGLNIVSILNTPNYSNERNIESNIEVLDKKDDMSRIPRLSYGTKNVSGSSGSRNRDLSPSYEENFSTQSTPIPRQNGAGVSRSKSLKMTRTKYSVSSTKTDLKGTKYLFFSFGPYFHAL